MQHQQSIRTKLATIRQREQHDESELQYLEDVSAFGSDFIDEIVDRIGSSRSYYDGGTDEREYARALSYAGFATSYRY